MTVSIRDKKMHKKPKSNSCLCDGSIHMGPSPLGTGRKLLRISLLFRWDLLNLVRIRSALWYQIGPLVKVILHETVLFQFQTIVDPIPNGPEHIQTRVNLAL